MLPRLELGGTDVNGSPPDMTKQDVGVPDDEFIPGVAHWRRPIAAAARLMKQDRAVLMDDFFDEPERRRCRRNLVFQMCLRADPENRRRGRKRPRRQVEGELRRSQASWGCS